MERYAASRAALARCHGYDAVALDGTCGTVETPLFPPDTDMPDYLVLRLEPARGGCAFPIVAAAVVDGIDLDSRSVHLQATIAELALLPQDLPLVG